MGPPALYTSGCHTTAVTRAALGYVPCHEGVIQGHPPDSKVHGVYMGPTWGKQDPCGPHVGPLILIIWTCSQFSEKGSLRPVPQDRVSICYLIGLFSYTTPIKYTVRGYYLCLDIILRTAGYAKQMKLIQKFQPRKDMIAQLKPSAITNVWWLISTSQ